MKKNVVLGIIFIVAAAGSYLLLSQKGNDTVPNEENNNVNEIDSWKTYTDSQYGFEIKYPADWKFTNDVIGGEPRFSFYKVGEAPLSHHVNATQVSIFPKGLGTEGPGGESRVINSDITAASEKVISEFYLANNNPRGYFITFLNPPSGWESYGYVWAAVMVNNLQYEELPSPNPDYIPPTRASGEISEEELQTVQKILTTFKFIN